MNNTPWRKSGLKSPCMNCSERHQACHDSCDAYKEFASNYHDQAEWKKKNFLALNYACKDTMRRFI